MQPERVAPPVRRMCTPSPLCPYAPFTLRTCEKRRLLCQGVAPESPSGGEGRGGQRQAEQDHGQPRGYHAQGRPSPGR